MNRITTNVPAEELREYASDSINSYLGYYASRLTFAAARERRQTVYIPRFTVAVNASVLLRHRPHTVVARQALEACEGFEVVEHAYPRLAARTAADWIDAADAAWQTVRFTPEAAIPQDRSVFGHIELLEALGKHTATIPSSNR